MGATGSYPKLHNLVDLMWRMNRMDDLDSTVGISGFKGCGKSTLSIHMARFIVKDHLKDNFQLEKYVAYSLDDVNRLAEELDNFSPLVMDEAVNFALGEDWMISEHKALKKTLTKIRTKHLFFFFNIPDLWWLDKKYRENLMNMWLHIVKKGIAVFSLPNLSPGIEDRWFRKWLIDAFKTFRWNYFSEAVDLLRKMRIYPCYQDSFTFPKLNAEIYAKHLRLRDSEIFMTKGEFHKERPFLLSLAWYYFYNHLKQENPKLTFEEFTKIVTTDPNTNKPLRSVTNVHQTITFISEYINKLQLKSINYNDNLATQTIKNEKEGEQISHLI